VRRAITPGEYDQERYRKQDTPTPLELEVATKVLHGICLDWSVDESTRKYKCFLLKDVK